MNSINRSITRVIFAFWISSIFLFYPFELPAQSFLPIYQSGSGTFEEDLVIGADIDDEDYFLFGPSDMGIDSKGNLFVLDSRGYCIKKFDPEGVHLNTFGRKGEGPGEMTAAFQMEVDPQDNIVIYDLMNRRFSYFDNEGTCFNSVSLNELGLNIIHRFDIGPDGNLYVEMHKENFEDPRKKTLVKISRFSPTTMEETVIDSVYIKKKFVAFPKRHSSFSVDAPYYPELLWGIAPSGNIVIANSDNYVLKIYAPDLSLLSEGQFGGERQEVTNEDREDYFDGFKRQDNMDLIRKIVEFPKYKPYFIGLFIDHEGYILVEKDEGKEKKRVYDVFTPEGKFLNEVTLPRMRLVVFNAGFIYTVERREDDNIAIYRKRLK